MSRPPGRRHRHHGRPPARPAAPAAAVLFTWPECWAEHFPARPCPPDRSDTGAAICLIGGGHIPELAALGFEVTPGVAPYPEVPGVFCPHITPIPR